MTKCLRGGVCWSEIDRAEIRWHMHTTKERVQLAPVACPSKRFIHAADAVACHARQSMTMQQRSMYILVPALQKQYSISDHLDDSG